MTEVRYKEVATYYNVCKTCGKEFAVFRKDSEETRCNSCRIKSATIRTQEELSRFIGATITSIKPVGGKWPSSYELMSINVETVGDKCVKFLARCDNDDDYESWITWSER